MNTINVLLTGTGAPGAPGIIKCLRNNGERNIRIIGCDANSLASGRKLVDKFYEIPKADNDRFIDAIMEICRYEKIQSIIPLVTRELYFFAKNKKIFEKGGIKVSVMDYDLLYIVNNKIRLLNKMRELGMKTPEFYVIDSINQLKEAAEKLGYPQKPICIKASEGNGSRGIRFVDPFKSLYDLLFNEKPNSMYITMEGIVSALSEKETIPKMMVMEFLDGEEYGIDALAKNGKVEFICGRRSLGVNSSIPQGAIIENRELPIKIAYELIEKLKLDGNINFDFIYKDEYPYLIEINPRLSATVVSYAPAGINFPYLRIKELIGEELPTMNVRQGIVMQRRYEEIFFDENGKEMKW